MTIYGGQCRCGRVRFKVSGPPLLTSACHCTECQRMTAGPFSLSALSPEDRFQLSSGHVVVGRCNSAGQHCFCETCFSWVYTKPGGLEGVLNIRTPMLEDAAGFPPFAEFFTQEILPRMTSGAPLSFETAPSSAEEFLKLTDAYAEWGERPA